MTHTAAVIALHYYEDTSDTDSSVMIRNSNSKAARLASDYFDGRPVKCVSPNLIFSTDDTTCFLSPVDKGKQEIRFASKDESGKERAVFKVKGLDSGSSASNSFREGTSVALTF